MIRISSAANFSVDILKSEEEHIDRLQTQIRLIEQMGFGNFVRLQVRANQNSAS